MTYGKSAYLKVLDIEKELTKISPRENSINYCEIDKPNLNQSIINQSNTKINLGKINVQENKEICLQIKTSLYSNEATEINYGLIINDLIIYSNCKIVDTVETDLIILKTYTPLLTQEINIDINFATNEPSAIATIKNISAIIIGAMGENDDQTIDLRALEIQHKNEVIVSYIDNNQLYFTNTNITEKTFSINDFKLLFPAKSHCFCLKQYPTETELDPVVLLYFVDLNNNLYCCDIFNTQTQTLLDTEVNCVFAKECPLSSDDLNIVTYIKNDQCYYLTLRQSGFINPKELPLPTGKYSDIRIVSDKDIEHVYIVATNKNGSNYLLHSVLQIATGKITEFLQADYSLLLSKYIDLKFLEQLSLEHIYINCNLDILTYSNINNSIEKQSQEILNINCELKVENYEIKSIITYGVKLDKTILTGKTWATYTNDSVNFEPAYMDFDTDTFVDSGWYNRWPFNEIKPCLLNNSGQVTAYLNPNDFSQLADGTPVDIESNTSDYVMIEIPKIYYKISKDDDNIYVQISNDKQEGFFCDGHVYKGVELNKVYISAYINSGENYSTNGFRIHSNTNFASSTAVGYTATCYNALKEKDGLRYEFMPYNLVKLIQCLYIIMFKNTDSQSSLGLGFTSSQTTHTTGLLNKKGMCYGTTSSKGIKFIGLEDFYGCRAQIMSGFYLDKSADKIHSRARYIDVYNPNSDYHPDKYKEYLSSEHEFIIGSVYARVAIDVNKDVQISGFYGSSISSDKSLGFCDNTQPSTALSSYGEFGTIGSGTANGIFSMKQITLNNTSTKRSARLVYYP